MSENCNYPLSLQLSSVLTRNNLTLALAESCTGGCLSHNLTSIKGASHFLECSFVTYSNQAKIDLLGVNTDTIEQFGSVSKQCAMEMVQGALNHSQASLAVALTGIAGPTGGSEAKPVGTVYISVADQNRPPECKRFLFTGGRKHIRRTATQAALEYLLTYLMNRP